MQATIQIQEEEPVNVSHEFAYWVAINFPVDVPEVPSTRVCISCLTHDNHVVFVSHESDSNLPDAVFAHLEDAFLPFIVYQGYCNAQEEDS